MKKTCIVVPCYNEAKRLKPHNFLNFLEKHKDICFLFVNDGGLDATKNILDDLAKKSTSCYSLDLKKNVGKAEAVRAGIMEIKNKNFSYIGIWDADLSTPLWEIEPFLNEMQRKDISFLLGSRVKRLGAKIKRSWIRHILGRCFSFLINFIFSIETYDTQCGAKIIEKQTALRLFEKKFISRWLYDLELVLRYKYLTNDHSNKKIMEIPVSKWIHAKDSKITLKEILYNGPKDLIRIYLHYSQKK